MTEEEIYAELAEAGVTVEKLEHAPMATVADSIAIHDLLDCAHTKNLFLKDKKGKYWLVVLPAHCRAEFATLTPRIGAAKLSFGKPEDMQRLLGVTPGAVTALGVLNARPDEISIIFDASFEGTSIAVHPLRNTATIMLPFAALWALLEKHGHKPRLIDLQ
jgi:Ala-tRNA(Pro) deacylase